MLHEETYPITQKQEYYVCSENEDVDILDMTLV